MAAVPMRHRSLTLLGAVLLIQVLALAVQIRTKSQGRLIRVWVVEVVVPFERAGNWTITKFRGVWNGYFGLIHTQRENAELHAEVDRLRIRNTELESESAESARLAALLGFRDAHPDVPMLAARVIAASADSSSHTIFINRGEHDGIHRNMAVITPDGVVGKVFEVYRSTSQVLLLTDKESGVGALLAGSRTQGPVGGVGEPLMTMKYISNDENVTVGQQVLTSGEDQIYPKDLPVGTVTEVKTGTPFKVIRVKPAARLDRLEEVLVLLTRQELVRATGPETPAPANSLATPVKHEQ
ncbi:MAG TPA: rod shape-determining protein MreC [Candidatus Acidoferrum sp.]|nr:rod shape-determining protein MreC [Candidatus Acidoferrum sp.]